MKGRAIRKWLGKKLYLYMELEVRMNLNRFEFSLNFGWRPGVQFGEERIEDFSGRLVNSTMAMRMTITLGRTTV
jgi:hypothetical protein